MLNTKPKPYKLSAANVGAQRATFRSKDHSVKAIHCTSARKFPLVNYQLTKQSAGMTMIEKRGLCDVKLCTAGYHDAVGGLE